MGLRLGAQFPRFLGPRSSEFLSCLWVSPAFELFS